MPGSRLGVAEREEIAIGLACRESVRQLAPVWHRVCDTLVLF
jgi:hypothetical protein